MSTLAPGALVVIVGITGYIASHAGLSALQAGFRVRGTVRSLSKASELRKAYEKAGVDASPEKLEIVVLDDLESEEQFSTAFDGAEAVINLTLPDFEGGVDYVQKTVDAMLLPLRVAAKVKTLKRYILTSTMGAVDNMAPIEHPPAKPLGEDDWNEKALEAYKKMSEEGAGEEKDWWTLYLAGKTMGEKAAWEFVQKNKVSWDFIAILPGCTWGPVLFGEAKLTASMITKLFEGIPMLYQVRPQAYIDVRDCGELHARALTEPWAGKRIIAAAGLISIKAVMDDLRKAFPASKFPEDPDAEVGAMSKWTIDNAVATKALGGWFPLRECVVDTAKSVGY